jgi:hypothetical protein
MSLRDRIRHSAQQTLKQFAGALPIMLGVLLLTTLLVQLLPGDRFSEIFTRHPLLDALVGAALGSIAAGPPLTSYILGGELLKSGISLAAVTALVVSWVTVGVVQLPAEMMMLGKRFAIYRNTLNFVFAILIALLTTATLIVMEAWLRGG